MLCHPKTFFGAHNVFATHMNRCINLLSQVLKTDVKHRLNANHSYNEDCLWLAGHWSVLMADPAGYSLDSNYQCCDIMITTLIWNLPREFPTPQIPPSKKTQSPTTNMNIKFTDRTSFPNIRKQNSLIYWSNLHWEVAKTSLTRACRHCCRWRESLDL